MHFIHRGIAVFSVLLASVGSWGDTLQLGWQKLLPTPKSSTFASAGAQDAMENFYFATSVPGAHGDTAYLTKFNSFGDAMWTRSFVWNSSMYPQTVTTDTLGHVVLTLERGTGGGKTRVDLIELNSTTGAGVFTKTFQDVLNVSTVACGIQPSTNNIELCLSVTPTNTQLASFARNVILSPTGTILKSLDDPDVSPVKCIFDANGNMGICGPARLEPTGSAIAQTFSVPTLTKLWQKEQNGVYIAATKTQVSYSYTIAYDDVSGNLYLGDERSVQVNGALPAVQSTVFGFTTNGTLFVTGPTTSTAVFGISANNGLVVTGAGTDATYQHRVLSKLGSNGFTVHDDNLRDFCCHDGELYYTDCDSTGFNFDACSATGMPLIAPIHFTCPTSSYCYGGNLISQPNSFMVIGSYDGGGGVYTPCCEAFRDGNRFSSVQMPATCVSGTKIPITVQCNGPAPTGGIKVLLSSSQLTFPSSTVLIPAGQLSATTTALVPITGTLETIELIARGSGVVRSDTSTDTAAKLTKAEASSPVVGGNPVPVTITLSGKAPAGGMVITITSNDTTAVPTNQTITVPEGEDAITSFIDSKIVNSDHTVKLTYKDPSGTTLTQTITISK